LITYNKGFQIATYYRGFILKAYNCISNYKDLNKLELIILTA
ncbi:hypothetical protein FOXB_06896, partial [Fusarium oxysporum f. sp. conglutinans Fo5176]